jgi:hypothetical protein
MPTACISCSAHLRCFSTIFGHRAVLVNHKNHRSSSYRCPGRTPGSFESSLVGSNCRRENEICLYTSRQWPRRREQLVAEAAQRNVERGADEMREHIGGCPTACRDEATYPLLAICQISLGPRIHRRQSEWSEIFQVTFVWVCMRARAIMESGRNNYPA